MLTDIHNHILPNVDDGAQNIEESISLLKSAKKNQITTIYCTPHKNKFNVELSNDQINTIYHKFLALKEVKELNLNIKLAQEVTIKPKLWESIQKEELFLLTNNKNKKYLLLELPENELPDYLHETIHNILSLDVTPIIVHPERQNELKKQISLSQQLLNLGVEFQVNADSFLGRNGYSSKRFAYKLFKNGQITYLASDAHNTSNRNFVMKRVLDKLNKKNRSLTKKIIYNMNNF
ncbi:hypothetical protein UA3_00315 [Enterococcus faecium EnGen0263]|uniref:tyrosine-protein phosphatase n=1 Tax=Enterococcus TaxID=1350 RepID=UPI000330FCAB|nr:CpsB/CapC family capsule biosynthesis tyrosine phosphatase [Enterococcus faecium]EGP5401560.1 hypothetical protein [Enterococcus faecium]EGP5632707.1 hypothetical protein [Enterococcus faecium]EOH57825.1 hypothetical protein UA3_00315 [Enterococcus faecium EnGen0263]MBS6012498.1 hypothetical protein [Enterococcus faecium]PQC78623.1 hypothetical protein CUM69_13010 [Enterococcus faecium]